MDIGVFKEFNFTVSPALATWISLSLDDGYSAAMCITVLYLFCHHLQKDLLAYNVLNAEDSFIEMSVSSRLCDVKLSVHSHGTGDSLCYKSYIPHISVIRKIGQNKKMTNCFSTLFSKKEKKDKRNSSQDTFRILGRQYFICNSCIITRCKELITFSQFRCLSDSGWVASRRHDQA